MNSGTAGPTPATLEQQNIALQQMQGYWKNQIPALNYVIRTSKADQPGLETQAAGQAAAAGRAMGTTAATQGAVSPRGPFVGNVGRGLIAGANAGAMGAPAARMDSRGLYLGRQLGVIGAGNKILDMANKGLITAGGISTNEANARQQASQAQTGAAVQGGAALIGALASFA